MKKIIFVLVLVISCNQSKDEANIFFLKGNVALKDKNFVKAIEYYKESIKKQSEFADAYNNLGVCFLKLGDSKNAAMNFKKSIEIDANFNEAKLNYANLILENDPKTSLELLKKIEKTLNDSADFCNSRGKAEFLNANYSQASFYLDKAVQKQPNNAEFLTNLGTLKYYQKNYSESESIFLKSYKIDSLNAMTINNLGLISMKNKSVKTAELFKKAIKIEPENQIILNNYTYFLIKSKNIKIAEEILKKSENIDGQNPYLVRNKGLLLIEKNEITGIELVLDSYQKDATIENIHTDIGNAYFKIKNKNKACEFWQKGKLLNELESEKNHNKHCN